MKNVTPKHKNEAIIRLINELHIEAKKKAKEQDKFISIRTTFIRLLKKNGFKYMDSGGYKEVFHSPKQHPDFVIKVFRRMCDYQYDTCITKLPPFLRKYFLYPVKKTGMFMIQPKANNKRGNYRRDVDEIFFDMLDGDQSETASDMDIKLDNLKFHNGKPCVIDFCV
jgi:hemerythrin